MPPTLQERPRPTRRRELAIAILDDGREQRVIAEAAGINATTLSGVVTGRIHDPRPETRAAIASALGRPESELFPEHDGASDDDDETILAEVHADLEAQGIPWELSSEQERFIAAVVASALRDQRRASTRN